MSDQTEAKWPAWKVALAIGGAVAVGGIGYYYYKKSSSPEPQPETPTKQAPKASVATTSTERTQTEAQDPFKIATKLKNEGNTAFKAGKYRDAITSYTKAIEICPKEKKQDLSTFHQNKAAAYEKLEEWNGVVEECSKAIELNPRYIKALYRRSRALETLGRKNECLEDVTAACIMEQFQNPSTMVYADRILKEIGKEMAAKRYKTRGPVMPSVLFVKQYFASFTEDIISEPLTAQERENTHSGYIRARLALEKGDVAKMVSECTAEIENHEHQADAPPEAQSAESKQTTVMSPTSDDVTAPRYFVAALVLRATMLLLQGDSAGARPDLDMVINMDNADVKLRVNALVKRGSMFMQAQDSVKAKNDFDYALALDPNNTDVLHHRGQLNILLDKTEEALKDFEKCMKLKPDFELAQAQYCFSIYRQAFQRRDVLEMQRALTKFEEFLSKAPKCSEAYGLFAQALADQGDFQQADEMFEKAIELEPDNATQYVHRALLHSQWKQNSEQSVKLVQKALDVDEKCDFAHETMGTIEVQRGNLDKATEHFEIAISLAKSEPEMAHLYSLKAAAIAQVNLAKKYGIKTPLGAV